MRAFTIIALLSLTAAATATGCSAAQDDDVTGGASAYTGSDGGAAPAPTGPTRIAGSRLALPIPGSKNNRISAADQKTIVDAWLQAKKDYYDTPKYASGAAPALTE